MARHDYNTQNRYRKSYGGGTGFTVYVRQNADGTSDVNSALKQLKRRVIQDGLIKELRSREFYMSRGEKKRRKQAEAKRRQKRLLRNAEK